MRKLFLVILTGLVAVGVFAWSSGTLSISGKAEVSITYDSSESKFDPKFEISGLTIEFSDSKDVTGFYVKYSGVTAAYGEFYQYLFKSDAASLKFVAAWPYSNPAYSDLTAIKFGLSGKVGDTELGITPVIYKPNDELAFDINTAYVNLKNLGLNMSVAVYDVTSATPSIDLNASLDTSAFSDLLFTGSVYVSAAGGVVPDINEVDVSLSYTYDPYTFSIDIENTKADSGFETSVDAGVSYSTELPVIGSVDLSAGLFYSMAKGLENVKVSAEWTKELISHKVFVTFYPENPAADVDKAYAKLGWTGSFSF